MSQASPRPSTSISWTDRWRRPPVRFIRPAIIVPVETDKHPVHLGEALGILGAAMFGAVALWAIVIGVIHWAIPL